MTSACRSVVFYVDDDEDDIFMVREEFSKYEDIDLVSFGDTCKFLKHIIAARKSQAPPALIMLDINMPILNGKEVLTILRSYKEFNDVPIALYSTSSSLLDVTFAKHLNAQFVTKPLSKASLTKTIEHLVEYCRSRKLTG